MIQVSLVTKTKLCNMLFGRNLANPIFKWKKNVSPRFIISFFSSSSSGQSTRERILEASLAQVHNYGWSEEAIVHGVISSKLPPSYVGQIENKASDMIHFFMQKSNKNLKHYIQDSAPQLQHMHQSQVIAHVIQKRLEMNIPFIQHNRWHEAMALGAMPYNALQTAQHLEQLVSIIEEALQISDRLKISSPIGLVEKGAIGGIYFATELHLLTDSSPGYVDTWTFLKQRVQDLETTATIATQMDVTKNGVGFSRDQWIAASSVATSMAGALLSVLAPALTTGIHSVASSVIPHIVKHSTPIHATSSVKSSAKDYNVILEDLPPFESNKTEVTK